MLNLRKIVDPVVAILSCTLLFTGCTKEESAAAGGSEEQHKVTVQLNISTRAVDATTGALDEEESALYSLRVYAFVNGSSVGYEERAWTEGAQTSEAYYMDMDLTMVSASTVTVDFYVVANEAAMSGTSTTLSSSMTESALNSFYFTGLDLDNLETCGLPMYYKRSKEIDFDNLSGQLGQEHTTHELLTDTLHVELQRPMGKLGVFAAKAPDEMEGELYITSLTMLAPGNLSYNYLMPQSSTILQDIPSASTTTNVTLTPVTDEVTITLPENYTTEQRNNPSNYTPVLDAPYYPFENPWGSSVWSAPGGETEDPNGLGSVLQIDYTFDGVERTGLVYLPPIERNCYYAVCCLMHNGGISIAITVDDWDDPDGGTYTLDFDYPTYNPLMPYGTTEEPPYAQPTVYYNPDYLTDPSATEGSYSFLFTITGPEGQDWTPTLLDATTADFEVTVLQGGVVVDNPVASGTPYEIQVRALNPDNVGKTVQLAIAFTPSWEQTGSSLLLINSESAWTGSESTDRIVIQQIATP